jgi:hypothetical protein
MCIFLILFGTPAFAISPIPEKSGFSGYINLGGAYIKGETNMVKGTKFFEVNQDTIKSISESPDSESDFSPIVNGELAYTFSWTGTQIYLGNQLEDFLRFDFATLIGVRQKLPDGSIAAISYVSQPLVTEVWKDPYVAKVKRQDTDRESTGVRLEWDSPFGTNFGVLYQYRSINIDDEWSGTLGGLGLTPAQIQMLDREGDAHRVDLYYKWDLGGGHSLLPEFRYNKWDLDGDAMAFDGYAFSLSYAYKGDKFSFTATGVVGTEDYDKTNPIYQKTRDDDIYGIGVNAFWHRPFGLSKGFSLVGTLAWYESVSNIDFYDTQVNYAGLSMFYRF